MIDVILDCDPGIDDALAIFYMAADPQISIAAVGSIHGNIPAPLAAINARRLLDMVGLTEVPVAVGAHRPMAQPLMTAEIVHGDNGLGNVPLPEPSRGPTAESAAEQIVRLARESPGRYQLLAIGPLTNLGLALLMEPRLPDLIQKVVIMGGSCAAPGNISATAEANIWHDPEAADLVFQAPWDLTMIGLDVTMQTLLTDAHIQAFAASGGRLARFSADILQFYLDFYETRVGARSCALHDPLAAAVLTEPDLCTYEHWPVQVALQGETTRGATIAERRVWAADAQERPLTKVAMGVDVERFVTQFRRRIESA